MGSIANCGVVELGDELHIAEHSRIAGMIEAGPSGKFHDKAAGFPSVNPLAIVVDRVRVHGMSHSHVEIADPL